MAGLNKPYVTHIRYKSGLLEGIKEAIEIGRQGKCSRPHFPPQVPTTLSPRAGF